LKRQDWWYDKKIAYLDIETSNLDADWGFMLTWAIKYRGNPKVVTDSINKHDINDLLFDRRITESLVKELRNVDIAVTYYGTKFDVKFIRSRAMYYGLDFPEFGSMYHWDLYYKSKYELKLARYSLGKVTQFLGIQGKTPLDPEVLWRARYGDPKALIKILEHNIKDVEITEKLHEKLWRHCQWIRKSI
jgi:uncharacterized protein YprB with RNaseH-like and TPR domain